MSVEGDVDDLREQLEHLQEKQRQLLLKQERVNVHIFCVLVIDKTIRRLISERNPATRACAKSSQ